MLHYFFSSLARSQYMCSFPISFTFTLWSPDTRRSSIRIELININLRWSVNTGVSSLLSSSLFSNNAQIDMVNRDQNLDEAVCISHNANTLGKGMNPKSLPRAMNRCHLTRMVCEIPIRGFQWSHSEKKSPQVSRNILSNQPSRLELYNTSTCISAGV